MSYIGTGASVVGGLMQAAAASQEQRAMFEQFLKEQQRQRGYSNEAAGVFFPSLWQRGSETANQQIQQGATKRMADYAGIGGVPLAPTNPSYGSQGSANAKIALEGANRAQMGGLTDWQLNQMINDIRTNEELRRVSDFARGTAGVFPYRMYKAQHGMDELSFWGSLIGSLGGAGGNMASSFGGGGPPSGYFAGPGSGQGDNLNFGYDFGYQNPTTTLLWNRSGYNPFD